ncbi:hemolysin family protein [Paludisphaera mucosa]|uniref:Hemolysin family protein n=1 Tax=Paludisphaera mucosa TaxID=3030827 RepID=A0ABT6FAC9_9BACT|nr:hemolysin family protein [Paludisphaera mucosa]MDG3004546.1 hemolysin family protein [Paludisphaera mucosa]
MTSIVALVLGIVALLAAAGLFSLLEAALASSHMPRLRDQAAQGDRGAKAALELARDPEGLAAAARLAAATALTLAGAAAGGPGRRRRLGRLPTLAAALAIAAAAVLADAVPRALAAGRPEWFAARLARAMGLAARLTAPLAGGLSRIGSALARRLGARGPERPAGTEQKIKELMREGAESGAFDASRHAIFKRVFRFCDRRARALMTPRDKVVWLDVRDSPEEIARKITLSPHASLPVCDETLDNLLGMVQMKDLLARGAEGQPVRFKGLLTLPDFIYEGTRGPQILDVLRRSSSGAAVVLDEYGSVVGVITLADVRDALLGTTAEKAEEEDPRAVQRPDGSWLLDGRFPVDEFVDLFQIPQPPAGEFDTLGGLVVTKLGRIPRVGEGFEDLGLRFEVVDMDANRVDHVLVRPLEFLF